jgi:methionyl aminopeptidase
MHEDPMVPNHGVAGQGRRLKAGMVLAIEPMLTEGDPTVRILRDGWTVVTADGRRAAHVEHTVAITDAGPEVLTAA